MGQDDEPAIYFEPFGIAETRSLVEELLPLAGGVRKQQAFELTVAAAFREREVRLAGRRSSGDAEASVAISENEHVAVGVVAIQRVTGQHVDAALHLHEVGYEVVDVAEWEDGDRLARGSAHDLMRKPSGVR